jgi:uncharacterized protein
VLAEQRRQAVVERIRKKKEEEEAAIRRAEEARLHEIAEKERIIQLALERLRSDRSQMEMEDELSNLAQQLYKEQLEKIRWKREEEERLAAWEEEQRKKDELEAIKRKERLAEIEAKKAKLAELRKAQMMSSGNPMASTEKEELRIKDVQQAREDAIKLGKQMRIQNKAKYVSKQRKEDPLPTQPVENIQRKDSIPDPSTDQMKVPPPLLRAPSLSGGEVTLVELDPTVVSKIENSSTETELYQLQKDLMAEKRSLRIKIMSQNSCQPSQHDLPPSSINTEEEEKKLPKGGGPSVQSIQLQNRVNEITAMEKCIQNKMSQFLALKEKPQERDGSGSELSQQYHQNQSSELIENEILGGKELNSNLQPKVTEEETPARRRSFVSERDSDLYSNIEKCLQETNEIVLKYGIIDILSFDKDTASGNGLDSSSNPTDYATIIRRSLMLKMQLTEQLSKIKAEDDHIGYRDKITTSLQKISNFIEKHQQLVPTQKQHPAPPGMSLSPKVLERINSFSFSSAIAPNSPPKSRPPKKIIPNEVEISETTTAIGKKLLNLVRHEEVKKEEPTLLSSSLNLDCASPRGSQDLLTPRRRLGIAESKDRSARRVVNDEDPYIVSPRTRVSPRLYSLDSPTLIPNLAVNQPPSKTVPMKMTEDPNSLTPQPVSLTEPKEQPQPKQRPLLHPSTSNTVSSPVLISAHVRKVAGHVAIEITDLEDDTVPDKDRFSPKNSSSEEGGALKSCDSTSSMLSTGVSDNTAENWWNGNERRSQEKSEDTRRGGRNSSREVLAKSSPTVSQVGDGEDDDDDWWNQAGAVENNEASQDHQREDENEKQEEEQVEELEGEEFDYNTIPGWTECLHTTMATAAHHAAFYGYTQVLEYLSYYFDLFQMDKNGRTPLFYASLRNNLDCVLLLVSIDPQWIDVGDSRGDTPLHAAAISNGDEVLSFLITSGEIDPSIANYEGLTPIHLAKSYTALLALYHANATMYCVDNCSRMPLWYRCKDGNKEAVDLLCRLMPLQYIIWQDQDGNTPLHIACLSGHEEIVEILCQWYTHLSDYYIPNKKNYSIVHIAKSASILKKLYEYGIDVWIQDTKLRYPLFINSFQGKVDCVSLLIDIALYRNQHTLISSKDFQGDTALHAACLTGNIQCVSLLVYHIRDSYNKQGLLAYQLAEKAGYHDLARYVYGIEQRKLLGETSYDIFQCSFEELSSITLYYGTRWCKLYDVSHDEVYYYDRVLSQSQWGRPEDYDEKREEEVLNDKVRGVLKTFYLIHNPEKLININDILTTFRHKHQELFLQLAERYHVEDLSIFSLD